MKRLTAPMEPNELPPEIRRSMGDLVKRVVRRAAAEGSGEDLLLRVYMAGLHHGQEQTERNRRKAST